MKYGNAILFFVACSVSGYMWGMSEAPKPARPKCVFTLTRQGQPCQVIPLPGRMIVLDNRMFSLSPENNRGGSSSTVSLKRKPLSGIVNMSASKKFEGAKTNPAHEVDKVQQLRIIDEIKMQPTRQAAEEKLLQVCNARPKNPKAKTHVTLLPFPKDLVINIEMKNGLMQETIASPMRPDKSLNEHEHDVVVGLISLRCGQELLQGL